MTRIAISGVSGRMGRSLVEGCHHGQGMRLGAALDRTGSSAIGTDAGDLAGLLPPEDAAAARRDLRDLRVSVFVIHTVREQMRYDTPRLVVEAGKPFEIVIENDDFMPHNLVVVKPGAVSNLNAVPSTLIRPRLPTKFPLPAIVIPCVPVTRPSLTMTLWSPGTKMAGAPLAAI